MRLFFLAGLVGLLGAVGPGCTCAGREPGASGDAASDTASGAGGSVPSTASAALLDRRRPGRLKLDPNVKLRPSRLIQPRTGAAVPVPAATDAPAPADSAAP